jgi:hypothetical protein
MERAQRAADSPLRAILEASKLRPAAAPVAAVNPNPNASLNTSSASLPAPAPVARSLAAANPPPPAPVPDPGSPVVTIRTLPTEALPAAPARSAALAPTAVAPVRGASAPLLPAELPRPAPLPLAVTAPLVPPVPQLLHMVEPEVTPRLLDQLTRPEVAVEFTIRLDGSVSDVQVRSPVPRALVPVIAAAVEQWRFAPVPAPRPHRVQLVFKSGG